MPIIKSAIKRVRQTATRTQRNNVVKRQFRELIKKFLELIKEKNFTEATKLYPQVQKSIDMATKKNILHKNTAARKKSQLVKMIQADSKPAKEAKAEEKPAAKKTATKKPAAKKAATTKE